MTDNKSQCKDCCHWMITNIDKTRGYCGLIQDPQLYDVQDCTHEACTYFKQVTYQSKKEKELS